MLDGSLRGKGWMWVENGKRKEKTEVDKMRRSWLVGEAGQTTPPAR